MMSEHIKANETEETGLGNRTRAHLMLAALVGLTAIFLALLFGPAFFDEENYSKNSLPGLDREAAAEISYAAHLSQRAVFTIPTDREISIDYLLNSDFDFKGVNEKFISGFNDIDCPSSHATSIAYTSSLDKSIAIHAYGCVARQILELKKAVHDLKNTAVKITDGPEDLQLSQYYVDPCNIRITTLNNQNGGPGFSRWQNNSENCMKMRETNPGQYQD